MNKIKMLVCGMLGAVMLLWCGTAAAAEKNKNTPPKEWTAWLGKLKARDDI